MQGDPQVIRGSLWCAQCATGGQWTAVGGRSNYGPVGPDRNSRAVGVWRNASQCAISQANLLIRAGWRGEEGRFWVAANCQATLWRPARPSDAQQGEGAILEVDPASGHTVRRWPVPREAACTEWSMTHMKRVWCGSRRSNRKRSARCASEIGQHVIPLPYGRAHGVVRVEEGVWVVHTADRVIVKLDCAEGTELDRIEIPPSDPEPPRTLGVLEMTSYTAMQPLVGSCKLACEVGQMKRIMTSSWSLHRALGETMRLV